MNLWKKTLALCLTLALTLSLAACGAGQEEPAPETEAPIQSEEAPAAPGSDGPSKPVAEEEAPADTGVTMKVAAMTGPTGMGLAALLDAFGVVETLQEESLVETPSANGNRYVFQLAGTADEISPLLIKGALDAACVPANLASVLYNKTEGEIVTLGINTLGVLYIVDKGDSIQSIADLKGKTIVSAGKGSVPEYGLRYVLQQNGIDPDKDLTIEWKSEQAECVAALASGAVDIAMMPQPYVTVAQGKIEGLRIAVDLADEWAKLENGSAMLTGVVVARKNFVEENPAAIEAFMKDYAASVGWVNAHVAEAAQVIGEYGIVAAAVAEKAIPYCNIVCITGEEMAKNLSGYLAVLHEANPKSVGGKLPGEDFYFAG